jgi:FkbM family methyltransferase
MDLTQATFRLMTAFAAALPRARIVEIGANDGSLFDPLRTYIERYPWSGVLVEPMPHLFEKLRARYADSPRISLEQSAIGERDGWMTLHYLAPESAGGQHPAWHDALASRDRDLLLRNLGPSGGGDIREIRVPCLTFETLCRRHRLDSIDLILIDAEGADGDIVEALNLDLFHPRLLIFEHAHLPAEQAARCSSTLIAEGYEIHRFGLDTWALDLRPGDDLSESWAQTLSAVAG